MTSLDCPFVLKQAFILSCTCDINVDNYSQLKYQWVSAHSFYVDYKHFDAADLVDFRSWISWVIRFSMPVPAEVRVTFAPGIMDLSNIKDPKLASLGAAAGERPRIYMSNRTHKVVVVFPNGEVVEGKSTILAMVCLSFTLTHLLLNVCFILFYVCTYVSNMHACTSNSDSLTHMCQTHGSLAIFGPPYNYNWPARGFKQKYC